MKRLVIVGADPGGTTGLCRLTYFANLPGVPNCRLAQTDPDTAYELADHWLCQAITPGVRVLLAVEAFVVSGRAGRSGTASGGMVARELIGKLTALAGAVGVDLAVRPAGIVKPWATDRRITAAGISISPSMRHAADAVRHALFAATHDCGIPDPLSRKGKT